MFQYILRFIYGIITKNPVKLIYIILISVFLPLALNRSDVTVYYTCVGVIVSPDSTYLCVIQEIKDNNVEYKVQQLTEYPTLKNKIQENDSIKIPFFVVFIISGILLLISTIGGLLGEDEVGWNFKDIHEDAFKSLIKCEYEDGVYYYTALGRLLKTSQDQFPKYRIISEVDCANFKELRLCPKWDSKSGRRDNKLRKLGI